MALRPPVTSSSIGGALAVSSASTSMYLNRTGVLLRILKAWPCCSRKDCATAKPSTSVESPPLVRSEERRVGKECRCRGGPHDQQRKQRRTNRTRARRVRQIARCRRQRSA